MPVRRVSGAVLAYIVVAVLQLLVVLAVGGGSLSLPDALLSLGLLVFLFRGSPVAWWVLVLLNGLGLLALLIAVTGHPDWGHVVVDAAFALGLEALLLSPGMRLHIRTRGLRLAPRAVRR